MVLILNRVLHKEEGEGGGVESRHIKSLTNPYKVALKEHQ